MCRLTLVVYPGEAFRRVAVDSLLGGFCRAAGMGIIVCRQEGHRKSQRRRLIPRPSSPRVPVAGQYGGPPTFYGPPPGYQAPPYAPPPYTVVTPETSPDPTVRWRVCPPWVLGLVEGERDGWLCWPAWT